MNQDVLWVLLILVLALLFIHFFSPPGTEVDILAAIRSGCSEYTPR